MVAVSSTGMIFANATTLPMADHPEATGVLGAASGAAAAMTSLRWRTFSRRSSRARHDAAARGSARIRVPMADTFAYPVRAPVGVVGAISPWNSPIPLTLWKLCSALAAGNTVVIKALRGGAGLNP